MLCYMIIVALSCFFRCFVKVNQKIESESESENGKWKWTRKWNVREITWAHAFANRENKGNKLGQSEAKDFHIESESEPENGMSERLLERVHLQMHALK